MKKHRKQLVDVLGQKQLVDVPVDKELYQMDRHSEYLRMRSNAKEVSLNEIALADLTADIAEIYEEAQLLESLRDALLTLDKAERRLVQYLYYDALTERKAAALLKIPRTTLSKRKQKIIQKLRNCLIDWL